MPLTLEMINEENRATGKFIIDRNNLLFAFYGREGNIQAINTRKFLSDYVKRSFGFNKWFNLLYRDIDVRHLTTDHCSDYDKNELFYHYHFKNSEVIDFSHIEELFNKFNSSFDYSIDKVMSPNNRANMLVIIKSYFEGLKIENNFKIELFYYQNKIDEFNRIKGEIDLTPPNLPKEYVAEATNEKDSKQVIKQDNEGLARVSELVKLGKFANINLQIIMKSDLKKDIDHKVSKFHG